MVGCCPVGHSRARLVKGDQHGGAHFEVIDGTLSAISKYLQARVPCGTLPPLLPASCVNFLQDAGFKEPPAYAALGVIGILMVEELAFAARLEVRAGTRPKSHSRRGCSDLLSKIGVRLRKMSRQSVSHGVTCDVKE